MSKEEFLKIQTCTLKVSIHCDGCKRKVKKTLQKLDGVYTVGIDSEQGKVTVSGNFDPATLLKKLAKSGKNAEIWGAPKPNQLKNMQIDSGKGNQGQKGGGNNQQQPGKGAQPQQIQQLKQLQQLKGFQDLKLPMKLPGGGGGKDAQKSVKFNLPESDDDYDDDDDEFDDDDDDYDDDDDESDDDIPMKKPVMLGGGGGGNMMMLKGGQMPPQMGNTKGNIPVQVNGGGKKGGGAPGVGQNNNSGGGNNSMNVNGEKKGGMNDGLHSMPILNMMGMGPTGQGLPAIINGGGAEGMAGNPHYQQQLAAAMMNQQRSNGNERFQPMMYARPQPEVNYMQPPYPPYAYLQPPQGDLHGHYFNDDNTSSCSIM